MQENGSIFIELLNCYVPFSTWLVQIHLKKHKAINIDPHMTNVFRQMCEKYNTSDLQKRKKYWVKTLSFAHLSTILTHIGLASHHGPDVVVKATGKFQKKSFHLVNWRWNKTKITVKFRTGAYRIFRRILFTTSSILARDWWEEKKTLMKHKGHL